MSSVQLIELSKQYRRKTVLEGLCLDVEANEYLVLLGKSGCGKTTTLRVIAGIESSDGGRVVLGGEDVTGKKPRQRDVSMMFQGDGLYPHLSIRQSLAYPLKGIVDRAESEARIARTADRLGLESILDRRPENLSGGELRRAALAKSAVRQAAVRLLDEPLSALDGSARYQFQQDLIRWHGEVPGTTIHVTHDGDEAMRMADRIAVMDAGKIVQVGSPEEIYHHPSSIRVAESLGSPPINVFAAALRGGQLISPLGTPTSFDQVLQFEGDVNVAIRPESFKIATENSSDVAITVKATCRWRQDFGGRCHARFELADSTINAILERDCDVQVGDAIMLGVKRCDVHLFQKTGERINVA
ncbi:ABC transporter ATP-binding protein [Novipirellula sp. SH528]|uniref:ABC transporter ATP-binding protein n=1 Tax=Novipirellula sp. SH528 TaxID=3454466 RepID=UPI003F9F7C62